MRCGRKTAASCGNTWCWTPCGSGTPTTASFYWRDKAGREVDFVVLRGRDRVDLVECKMNPDELDGRAAQAFRRWYPAGENFLVSPAAKTPYRMRRRGQVFTVCAPAAV